MVADHSWLDSDELMALALQESRTGQHDAAIIKLKQILDRKPDETMALYLLAAEHAEIGMFDRAEAELVQVIERAPQLHTAHLQLGQIYLLQNRIDQARSAWAPLDAVGEQDPLFLFKSGLLAAAEGKLGDAEAYLLKAHEVAPETSALKTDIDAAITRVRATASEKDGVQPESSRKRFIENRYGAPEDLG